MSELAALAQALHRALAGAGVPHAFGGALALAYHVDEPRGTRDIDVNVFVPVTDTRRVFALLPEGVGWDDTDVERVERDGQVRLVWDQTPIDLFFSTHAFHEEVALHVRTVPFPGGEVPILGADDLAVFKAFFNRTKDWADIEAMAEVGSFDPHVVLGWLADLLGPDDERVGRLRGVIRRAPSPEPRFDPPRS
jgi:hypothetical protein